MEIEYAYRFSDNVFPPGIGIYRFYLWFIPILLLRGNWQDTHRKERAKTSCFI
ncbi:hypothetical protein [Endothiovibrio diazotrophicus]